MYVFFICLTYSIIVIVYKKILNVYSFAH